MRLEITPASEHFLSELSDKGDTISLLVLISDLSRHSTSSHLILDERMTNNRQHHNNSQSRQLGMIFPLDTDL